VYEINLIQAHAIIIKNNIMDVKNMRIKEGKEDECKV